MVIRQCWFFCEDVCWIGHHPSHVGTVCGRDSMLGGIEVLASWEAVLPNRLTSTAKVSTVNGRDVLLGYFRGCAVQPRWALNGDGHCWLAVRL